MSLTTLLHYTQSLSITETRAPWKGEARPGVAGARGRVRVWSTSHPFIFLLLTQFYNWNKTMSSQVLRSLPPLISSCPEIANKFWSDIIWDRKNNLIRCGWHTGNQQGGNQLKIELKLKTTKCVYNIYNEGGIIRQQWWSCSSCIVLSRPIIIILLSLANPSRPFHCQEREHCSSQTELLDLLGSLTLMRNIGKTW